MAIRWLFYFVFCSADYIWFVISLLLRLNAADTIISPHGPLERLKTFHLIN